MGGTILEEDSPDLDAKAVYAQLLAIADHARQLRKEAKTCTPLKVDGILGACDAIRTLCQEVTSKEKTIASLPDLGRITDDKQYEPGELRPMLTGIEAECFKDVGTLASVIALIPKEEASKS